ncbi:MAG: FAD-dependent oxidoreductase [Paracoccaceae bacterium]|nr:FAD-dependent oxidoreductase [Paracoccaceae bacterium]
MAADFPHLLSPVNIGPRLIRNRVLSTAHVPGIEEGGLPGPDYIAYQQARAKGGAGLQISGSAAIHRTGSVGQGRSLDNTAPGIVEGYARLADVIHDEGGTFLIQLGHAAGTVNDTDVGRPLLAPSGVQSSLIRETPRAMTLSDIDEMVEAYAAAAGKVRQGGLDGVEILGAFGFLPAAFLSPLSNQREDEYGGCLENRLRFSRRVIEAVRDAAGPDLIVGFRMPGDERVPGGLGVAELQEIAEHLAGTGKLDYLNVIAGTNYDRIQRMEHWPPTPAPHGLYVPLAAGIKARVAIPVFTTGRITDPAMAEDIVARGDADMVGMTRAQIADPNLVAKLRSNRADQIRPCIGANLCISTATEGKPLRCFVNPMAAREHAWGAAEPAVQPGRIVVIGGGPAGLEAARVAALRGHQVTLYEAAPALGGQLARWAKAPMSAEFAKTLSWYEDQLTRLQARVELGRPVTEADIEGLDASAVILATGARPAPSHPIDGAAGSPVRFLTPWEMLEAPPSDSHVVLIDEGGGRAGLAAIDAALDANRVTVITQDMAIGELINLNIRTPLYKRFLSAGAVFRPGEQVVRIEDRNLVTRNLYSGAQGRIEDVDCVIDWRGNQAVDDMVGAIAARGLDHQVIGDCLAPRQVHIAIAEGALAARQL